MERNNRRSSSATSRRVLTILLVLLAAAVLAFIFILINNKVKENEEQRQNGEVPGTVEEDIPEGLYINELMRGSEGFVEIVNNSDKTVDLGNYCLSDTDTDADKWRFPEAQLEPGAYAVVNLLGKDFVGEAKVSETEFNADFKVGSDETGIYLFSRGGKLLDKLIIDVNMPKDSSAIRTENGVAYTTEPTKGGPNSEKTAESFNWTAMDANDPVRINEVLPSNKYDITDEDGDRSDWVELYNSSDLSVDLSSYFLSDKADDPAKWALPAITLEPGEYLIVFLSGKDRTDGELHASFSLSANDDGLFLSTTDGMRQDMITVPAELRSNVSIGRAADGSLRYYPKPTPGAENSTVGFTDYMGVGGFNPSSVYISEVCSVTAPRSGEMDWIELRNGSDADMTLTGWHISDSAGDLFLYELSELTVPAGGYAVINCSTGIKDAWAHPAPFDLSPAGETVYLTDENGVIVDCFETGALRNGVTSGRENIVPGDGERTGHEGDRVFFDRPTKGRQNPDICCLSYAAAPVFSETELYRTEPFTVEISTRSADGTIHYTLDGSKPTTESPVYEGPIAVSENTVIRAVTCVPGRIDSEISTATYLFEQPHTIPVVTIAMDDADFREMYAVTEDGITATEKEGFMQFFETDGTLGIEAPAGFRVSGASTRKYPQKSLGVYFRAGYGRRTVDYPFFGEDYITSFGALVLRNAGQDWGGARLRDSFTSTAVLGMNIDASAARFVAVYINGRYWGLYDLKENINERYLESHYGVDPDTANIIKRNTYELEGSNADFLRVRAFAAQNGQVIPMTDERYAQFTQWVDAESFADYLIARDYFRDADMFNQKYWRTTDYKIRWRAIFYDSDFALDSPMYGVLHAYFNIDGIPSANGSKSNTDIYCGLKSNENWRHYFIVRYIYVVKYYLNNDRLLPLFDEMVAAMEPEISRQVARWNHPTSYAFWRSKINEYRSFLIQRPQRAKDNFMYTMGINASQYAAYEQEADALFEQYGGSFQRVFNTGTED